MAWDVIYYKSVDGRVPADEFLDACPPKVAANVLAVVDAVAWRASAQVFRRREVGGHARRHGRLLRGEGDRSLTRAVRLFCVLENALEAELAKRGTRRSRNRDARRTSEAFGKGFQRFRLRQDPRARRRPQVELSSPNRVRPPARAGDFKPCTSPRLRRAARASIVRSPCGAQSAVGG